MMAGEVEEYGLHEAGALPLRPGDSFRIEAEVTPAAYLYLLRVDTDGDVQPLYPWRGGDWGTRPAAEAPRGRLLPPDEEAVRLPAAEAVMETLLLAARAERWALDDAGVKHRCAGAGPQRPLWNARAARWFDNGQEVQGAPRRRRGGPLVEVEEAHPTLRLQGRLRAAVLPQ